MHSSLPSQFSVLVVDDDERTCTTLSDIIELHGYRADSAITAAAALELAETAGAAPSLAILDLDLPDMNGLALCGELRQRLPHLQVIILTGHASLDSAVSALRSGTTDYLVKPVEPGFLVQAVDLAEGRWRSSRVEGALLGNLERFRSLIENLSEVVTVVSPDGRIVYESPAVTNLLGYRLDQRFGREFTSPVHEDDKHTLQRCIEEVAHDQQTKRCTVKMRDASGTWRSIEVTANRVFNDPSTDGLVVTMVDVTERLQLETRLRQSEKMEAIGRLTGGLAHELNNLLAIVMANTESIIRDLPDDSPLIQDITDAYQAATQGGRLIEKLLGFSRQERLQLRPTDLPRLAEETIRMVKHTLPAGVKLQICPVWGESLVARVDRDATAHIVVNLVKNARDAMPDGGTIDIIMQRTFIDPEYAAEHAGAKVGEYVELEVRDNGCGMEADVLEKVFEPFFSTKRMSHGTGLGMAMVYGLVKQMSGYIHVKSQPGEGTSVQLFLPATSERVAVRDQRLTPVVDQSLESKRVLVAEDQPSLRRAMERALLRLGHTVHSVADGAEALEHVESTEQSYDLLIADIVMPRMGGLELHDQLIARGIDVPTLYTSGFTADEIQNGRLLNSGFPLLRKPWTIEELARATKDALRGTRALT